MCPLYGDMCGMGVVYMGCLCRLCAGCCISVIFMWCLCYLCDVCNVCGGVQHMVGGMECKWCMCGW